jgi:hypothetical protein
MDMTAKQLRLSAVKAFNVNTALPRTSSRSNVNKLVTKD